jgi:nucleoside 2-deoxyribosyltransferase
MALQRVPVVYLVGGMRTKWQDQVISAIKGKYPVIFIDPRDHGMQDERAYTSWDLEGVRRADIIFAYLEADNPSGAGLALEVGFAAGLSATPLATRKQVLFVCAPTHPHVRYFGMARQCSDAVFEDLQAGIDGLQSVISSFVSG